MRLGRRAALLGCPRQIVSSRLKPPWRRALIFKEKGSPGGTGLRVGEVGLGLGRQYGPERRRRELGLRAIEAGEAPL